VCLVDNAAVREVLADAADALAGRVLVNLTNGTPGQARALAAWAQNQGAAYLDGGIMAVPAMIGGPAASIFYSGPSEALEQSRDLLETFGAVRYVGEDAGTAAAWDLALLSGMYGMYAGVLLAVALGQGNGIRPTELIPALQAWLTAIESGLPQLAENVEADRHATASPLAMQAEGFPNLVGACEEVGVRADLLLPIGVLMRAAVAAGHGSDGISSTVKLLARSDEVAA
jgi:3-hydroxyisobutyrate dehydrogenase-like beta-hydroxyacid dehydrogenase